MASGWFDKARKQADAKKAANAGKPKMSFKRFFLRIGRFFKEIRSEFKKVVWPSKQEIWKSTLVVVCISAFAGVMIWGIDTVLSMVVSTFFRGV